MQLSSEDAQRLELTQSQVLRSRGHDPASNQVPGASYFELWIVPGPNSLTDLVLGVDTVYETYFGRFYSEAERTALLRHMVQSISGTVPVEALRGPTRRTP